jgi:hypothetical protein
MLSSTCSTEPQMSIRLISGDLANRSRFLGAPGSTIQCSKGGRSSVTRQRDASEHDFALIQADSRQNLH